LPNTAIFDQGVRSLGRDKSSPAFASINAAAIGMTETWLHLLCE
jgi:hypothetical protein